MTQIYKHLKPYIKDAVAENAKLGIPVQRPLFMHYENDLESFDIQYEYLFGRNLLVAPVYNQGETFKKFTYQTISGCMSGAKKCIQVVG